MSARIAMLRAATPPPGLDPGARETLRAELGALYRDVDAEIAASNPACKLSGECCHFERYGHRLYASRAEAVYFALHHAPPAPGFAHDRCPYLSGNRCTAREGRPLGCRVFFCDPAWKGKGEALTERALRRIAEMTDRLGIPWDYRPFLTHLDDMGEDVAPAGEKQEGSWPS
ncbi:MAG: hypothetical protein HYY18_08980 [Planctomycetes bacterium]|nr:hypothetical protein [Planctomycetota bacterium]